MGSDTSSYQHVMSPVVLSNAKGRTEKVNGLADGLGPTKLENKGTEGSRGKENVRERG